MRPYSELADIVLKLQNLDQIKEFLGNILNEVCFVKKKGELWIEEKETSTFEEVKEYIKKTTTDILQRCIAGTSNQFKNISDSATALESTLHLQSEAPESSNLILTESQSLTEKFEEIHSSFTLQSKKVKKLQQKANDQHKINKMLEEKIKKCDDNNAKVFKLQEYWNEKNSELKEEFTEEFQAASSFMSHLQTQYESLSHEFKENKAMDMIEVLQFTTDDIIEKILRRQQDMYEKLDHLETEQYHLKKNYADKKKARKNLGHHEQQIFESDEGDCQGYLKNCTKNPGHIDFIRVSNLRLDILPQDYRDPVLYGFIKAVSDLTVKISVTTTSPHRPKFWPGTNVLYPLYKAREKQLFRTGSGKINAVNRRVEAACPCDKCKNSDKPKTDWWEIEVTTAASVVFDESEASFATVRLFYDTEESEDVSVKCAQHSGLFKSIERDLCWFNCVTCDTRLAGKLEKMRQSYEDFLEIVAQKYTLTREIHKLMFLVSHPHGCCKRISFGQWNEKYIVKTYFDKFTYSTCTCPGSSGARVYCLGYAWSIHEGNMKCGLNYSSG
ncbi:uncharacterized protein LOC129928104 isoform X2 [Biomphalaria glabrata]|uniref:Uncharacterized protein LOC129928104 isoform X2 n=1 Tax=Biomphalaria glabrata TaxID=6526 RepID=A0A9W3BAY3_BIOGL|nr:uncharacterized protein LOC129928104 isoform X2 [Biomphalaria glabrata]